MDKATALRRIKELRDAINDSSDTSATAKMWENAVCYHLDAAADVIEFPNSQAKN